MCCPDTTDTLDDADEQVIDEVVMRVLASFRESASADEKLELDRARPSIPREIDRALLLDASVVADDLAPVLEGGRPGCGTNLPRIDWLPVEITRRPAPMAAGTAALPIDG